jgi:hypothetical protein
VHRDLKLDNLLLVAPGDITCIKLADFGFAKKVQGARQDAMKTVCGTPGGAARAGRGLARQGCLAPLRDLPPCETPCFLQWPLLLRLAGWQAGSGGVEMA